MSLKDSVMHCSNADIIKTNLITLLRISKQGKEIYTDLQAGLHTLPVWMQHWLRELLLSIEDHNKDGVFEYKIDFGPGYRVYFGQDGDELVILLGGGTKKQQDKDIIAAKKFWAEYKLLKKQENKS